ncbi:histone-lysine N-methyltransferase SETD1B-like [Ischnura elegans]|uniref:histone-lysine N-methyltransferase SETD1B-like n=1 Tax=Ischnura elegans TaxID=197161 RepID=UPI001ED869E1|nr:histone-lysine N-methyltransferase SETD1B-like [Ischnura elegans]
MTIVLHKTLILLALISSSVFAKSLRHHKRENRAKEPAHSWAVKYDIKTDGNRDIDERNYGSQASNALSSSQGPRRLYRDSDRYDSDRSGRSSSNIQRASRDAADGSEDSIDDRNFPMKTGGRDAKEKERSGSKNLAKHKRSSVPIEKVEEEEYLVGGDAKYDRMSDPDEAYLREDDQSGYGSSQVDALGDQGLTGGESDIGDAIEEGQAVDADAGVSAAADGDGVKSADDAEDGVSAEDAKSLEGAEERGAQRRRRNSRDSGKASGMRRSSTQRKQDEDEREEEEEDEWGDGSEYNSESAAVDFPYEKGYLQVEGLDDSLASDEVDVERAAFAGPGRISKWV